MKCPYCGKTDSSVLESRLTEDEGSTNTAIKNVQISNGGTVAFSWTASANDSWITLSPAGGALNPSEVSAMDVGVDIAGTGTASGDATVEAALLAERLLAGRGAD